LEKDIDVASHFQKFYQTFDLDHLLTKQAEASEEKTNNSRAHRFLGKSTKLPSSEEPSESKDHHKKHNPN
jgi:hypothetical protein